MHRYIGTLLTFLAAHILSAQDLAGYYSWVQAIDSTPFVAIRTDKFSDRNGGDKVTLVDTRTPTPRALELPEPIFIHGVWLNNHGRYLGGRYILVTGSTGGTSMAGCPGTRLRSCSSAHWREAPPCRSHRKAYPSRICRSKPTRTRSS